MEDARNGDMDAFAALFEDLRPMVHRAVSRLVGESDAYDVTMAAFLKAWQSLPGFHGRSSLRTWLYRIAYHAAIDHLRARTIREVPAGLDAGETDPGRIPDTQHKSPDEQAAENDLARKVEVALKGIPPEHREVVLLRYAEGLSYREIAAATGISIGTVMSRLFNARRKLRRLLEEEIGEV